jgi:hypothetical protein
MTGRNVRTVDQDDPQDSALGAGRDLKTLRNDLAEIYDPRGPQLIADFQSEEDEVNAVLAEAGGAEGSGTVVYRKKNPLSGKFEWLGKCASGEFVSLGGVAYLAGKFGGGDYELIVYGVDNRIIKRPKVTVSPAAIAELKTPETRGNGDLTQLIAVMQEGFKQMAQMIMNQANPRETKADWLNEMRTMREVFGNSQQAQPDMLGMLTKLIPAVRDLVPRDGDTNLLDVMMRLAQEFGPVIKDAMQKMPQGLNTASPAPVSLPSNLAAQPAASATPEQVGANQMSMMLKAQLTYLCGEAQRDADPGPYAALICDKVSPEVLSNLINNENWLDELGKVHPSVKLFPQWFGELREAVVEIMTEPEGENHDDLTSGKEAGKSRETT